jgi:hypothetical protein
MMDSTASKKPSPQLQLLLCRALIILYKWGFLKAGDEMFAPLGQKRLTLLASLSHPENRHIESGWIKAHDEPKPAWEEIGFC